MFWMQIDISETNKQRVLVWRMPAPGVPSVNEISVFFYHKYLLNRFDSDFVFLDVGRHQSESLIWNSHAQTFAQIRRNCKVVEKFDPF